MPRQQMALDLLPADVVREVGPGQLEVLHLVDGRKLLALPGGKIGNTWFELLSDQAAWLAKELSK